MAPRPAWKGYLKLSLVTCAVELSNATTQSEKVSFRILNRKTGNTVKRRYVDAESGKPVSEKNEVKGYEIDKDEFLLIEEEDIEAVQIESSHTMNLETFVQKSEIDEVYLDTPYYLTPADEVSEEAFAVIRDALAAKKMAGLARVVLYRRERPVVIEPLGNGMLLTTLRYDNTVRKPSVVFDEIEAAKVDAEMLELATRIVKKKKTRFQPEKFEDKHQQALLDLIETKKAGRKPAKAKAGSAPSNVVNLFDALKKSLATEEDADDEPAPPKKGAPSGSAKTKAGAAKKKKTA